MTNAGKTKFRNTAKAGAWSSFDRLPKNIRMMLKDAPFNYSTRSLTSFIRKHGVAHAESIIRASMEKDVKRAALVDFGADHPQALEA